MLKLYIASVDEHDYDEYDSVVVAAKDETEALKIALNAAYNFKSEKVQLKLIANKSIFKESKAVHISFNAG